MDSEKLRPFPRQLKQPAPIPRDVWDLIDEEYGRELTCTSIKTLASYLLSPSTSSARTSGESTAGIPSAIITAYGPVTDDGTRCHVSYRLRQSQFVYHLTKEEQRAFIEKLFAFLKDDGKVPSWRLFALLGVTPEPKKKVGK